MNRMNLERTRWENRKKLEYNAFRPKDNAVEVDINNSYLHELRKFRCVWFIRKGIPAIKLPDVFSGHEIAENFFINFRHEWERPVVITEARFKKSEQKDFCYNLKTPMKNQTRRVDIFILDTGEKVEIETNPKVKKEDSITVYI